MKIAFDHQIFSQQQYGGISRYFTELTRHLNILDVKAKIFAGLHINHYLNDLEKNQVMGIKVEPIPRTTRIRNTINQIGLKPFCRQWQPSIYHHTYYSADYVPSIPNVITVYDMIYELYPNDFSPNDKTRAQKKKSINQADHVMCISQATKQDLMQILNIPEQKISVVYLGFLSSQNSQEIMATMTGTYAEKPYLLYVGARGGYKNFANLIIAYSQSELLRDNFDIVAFGGGAFTQAERNLIHQLKLAETSVKNIQGNDRVLTALYQNAQAFIYPSIYEGFGIPPLEAMAHNCPVICSNTSSIPEVVGDSAVYFDPNNLDDMQYKIETVIQDKVLQEDLQARGQQRIQQFSWQKCAEETLRFYQKII